MCEELECPGEMRQKLTDSNWGELGTTTNVGNRDLSLVGGLQPGSHLIITGYLHSFSPFLTPFAFVPRDSLAISAKLVKLLKDIPYLLARWALLI